MDTSDDSDDDFNMGDDQDICLFDDDSDDGNSLNESQDDNVLGPQPTVL